MRYYPIYLDIKGKHCLIVGGGDVGTRKAITLLDCGAHVTVVSPDATVQLQQLAENQTIRWVKRAYVSADLDRMFLVIGATSDQAVNLAISSDAVRVDKLCNIADRPEACNFILPSIVRRGDLVIAVSTSGKSPAFAKTLRKELEGRFGNEYAEFLYLMGKIRDKLLTEKHEPEAHKPIFESLIEKGLIDLIRMNDIKKIDDMLRDVLGNGFDSASLLKTDE
ncbi:MAG: siroheme synthase [Deltaproteobacteria bacterium RBG_13_49_15]|nr:MAG: siroheme synthase [Deltaproteobacteria bacterium RBG_13_49_15]